MIEILNESQIIDAIWEYYYRDHEYIVDNVEFKIKNGELSAEITMIPNETIV